MSWRSTRIDALRAPGEYTLVGGPFGSNLTSGDYRDTGVPVIRGGNLPFDAQFRDEDFVFVSEEKADALYSNLAYPGDVIFTQRGTLGQVGLIPTTSTFERYVISQSQMKLTVDCSRALPEFVYYSFRDPNTVARLMNLSLVAGVPHINLGILRAFEIFLPDIDTQRAIVDHLMNYDRLIANNQRRITLLEEAARQLYREWFVRLRFPGAEHTAVVDGLPEGWSRRALASILASLDDGDWIESKDQGGEDYRLLQVSNVGVNDFVETGNFRYIDVDAFRRLNCREVLPGYLLISRMPDPIGRTWLVREMPWRMVTAVDVAIAVPDLEVVEPLYLVQALNSPEHLAQCSQRSIGATRARIPRRILGELPVVVPPRSLQQLYAEHVAPMARQRAVLERMNAKLRTARDVLLPRLMSGQLTV